MQQVNVFIETKTISLNLSSMASRRLLESIHLQQ